MSYIIKLKRGTKIELKKYSIHDHELVYITDTKEAVIGTENGPVVFAKNGEFLKEISISKINNKQILTIPYSYKKEETQDLKTLEEFNEDRIKEENSIQSKKPCLNGIECPNCGKELVDSAPDIILLSCPAKKNIHCVFCDYVGYRIA